MKQLTLLLCLMISTGVFAKAGPIKKVNPDANKRLNDMADIALGLEGDETIDTRTIASIEKQAGFDDFDKIDPPPTLRKELPTKKPAIIRRPLLAMPGLGRLLPQLPIKR